MTNDAYKELQRAQKIFLSLYARVYGMRAQKEKPNLGYLLKDALQFAEDKDSPSAIRQESMAALAFRFGREPEAASRFLRLGEAALRIALDYGVSRGRENIGFHDASLMNRCQQRYDAFRKTLWMVIGQPAQQPTNPHELAQELSFTEVVIPAPQNAAEQTVFGRRPNAQVGAVQKLTDDFKGFAVIAGGKNPGPRNMQNGVTQRPSPGKPGPP